LKASPDAYVNTFAATQAYQPINLVDGPNIAWNLDAGNLAHVTLGAAGRTLSFAAQRTPGRSTWGSRATWLKQLDNAIVGHGISLLWWRSGGVKHPHDMPPSPFHAVTNFGP